MGPRGEGKIQRCCACSGARLSVQLRLRYLIISQDQRDQSYSTVKTTSTAVTVNNLKPGTLYIFQIRTSSSPDYGNYNPSIEVETLAECKCWYLGREALGAEPWGCCCSLLLPHMLVVSWSSISSSSSSAPGRRGGTSKGLLLIAFSYMILSPASALSVLEESVLALLSASVSWGQSLCSSTEIAQGSAQQRQWLGAGLPLV